jgi:pentafunctional AROM polypeptide
VLSSPRSLPKRQISNGMAEVIKTYAIRNEAMFKVVEDSYDKVFDMSGNEGMASVLRSTFPNRPIDVVQQIIVECVKIKAAIVTEDETENGPRSLLNFGHTVGHAIEVCCYALDNPYWYVAYHF